MHLKAVSKRLIYTVITIILLGAVWELLALVLDTTAFPSPREAIRSFGALFFSELMPHLKISLYRVGISLIVAAILGIPLGLFLGKNRRADEVSAPFLYLTFPIPKVVFLPIFLILLGIGDLSKKN